MCFKKNKVATTKKNTDHIVLLATRRRSGGTALVEVCEVFA